MCTSGLSRSYDNCVIINLENAVTLSWSVDSSGTTISIGIQGRMGGYLALGLSDDGSMIGDTHQFADAWVVRWNGLDGARKSFYEFPASVLPTLTRFQHCANNV